MQIVISFDNSVAGAPAGFKAAVNAVAQYYDTLFTNPISVSIDVGYGEVQGTALSRGSLGESDFSYFNFSYRQTAAALQAAGAAGSSTLPVSSPISGSLDVATPEAKALGLANGFDLQGPDGYVGFSSSSTFFYDPTQSRTPSRGTYDFMGTVEHEFSEVLGRSSYLTNSGNYGVLDLYRFSANGVRQIGTGNPSYFSIDNGATDLNNFNNNALDNGGDLGDWSPNTPLADSYNDESSPGVVNGVSNADKMVMAALGYSEAAGVTPANAVPTMTAAAAVSAVNSGQDAYVAVSDSAANISAELNALQSLAASQSLASVTLTGGGAISLSIAQLSGDQTILNQITPAYSLAINDSAANVDANLATLQSYASAGRLASIALTDGGIPSLALSPNQLNADTTALRDISSYYVMSVDGSAANISVSGISGRGLTLNLSGAAAGYSAAGAGDGTSFTLTSAGSVDHLSAITALKFSDFTDFVASQTTSGAVSSAQVTNLYAAVLNRLPDVPGLAYYEQIAATNPSLPITFYAEFFLQSPEYTSNPAHSYAQNSNGDQQFVTDTYANLLHRAPENGAVAYYLNTVINPIIGNATPGTAAYTSQELLAHAAVLADFSQSAEFIGDVQITSAHPADASHWLILI